MVGRMKQLIVRSVVVMWLVLSVVAFHSASAAQGVLPASQCPGTTAFC
jgi:hypothetical protein